MGWETILALAGIAGVISVVWVYFDARRFDWTGNSPSSARGWAFVVWVLWPVFFPWYLWLRRGAPRATTVKPVPVRALAIAGCIAVVLVVLVVIASAPPTDPGGSDASGLTPVDDVAWLAVQCRQFDGPDGSAYLDRAALHAQYQFPFNSAQARTLSAEQIAARVKPELVHLCQGARGDYEPLSDAIEAAAAQP